MDRLRQSLFSILGDLEGVSFLDLFSGTGCSGSRQPRAGADPVLLVEKDPRKKSTIHRNISFVEGHIDLVITPVERFLRSNTRGWDIIFLDPPFDFEGKGTLLDAAGAPPHLNPGGLVLMHLHTAEKLSTDRQHLTVSDRREYGQSLLLFFRRKDDA